MFFCFFFQAVDGIRDLVRSRGLGDVYKRQGRDPGRDPGCDPGCDPGFDPGCDPLVVTLVATLVAPVVDTLLLTGCALRAAVLYQYTFMSPS